MSWPGKFSWNEVQAKQIVTSDLLRSWLGLYLDTEALPHGPLTPLLQYQVNLRRHRFTGLTTDGRLIAVVDKNELATRTTSRGQLQWRPADRPHVFASPGVGRPSSTAASRCLASASLWASGNRRTPTGWFMIIAAALTGFRSEADHRLRSAPRGEART
jgi:hypothetical protein